MMTRSAWLIWRVRQTDPVRMRRSQRRCHNRLMRLPFRQVDVFTTVPLKGNPVAVVFGADDLTTATMQSIAQWTNLSETTFVCTPRHEEADYRLRIFTPRKELPFAGHPTLGSAWAFLERGGAPKTSGLLMQECERGLVPIRLRDSRLYFALPQPLIEPIGEEQLLALRRALGVPNDVLASARVDVGAVWLTMQVDSAKSVTELTPDMSALEGLTWDVTGVTIFAHRPKGDDADIEVRSFAPAVGAPEDPVCGSGNGSVAALLQRDAVRSTGGYTASQGQCVGRAGRIFVDYAADGRIWIGGSAVTCLEGSLSL